MGNAEICQPFPALPANVAVNLADLEGILKEVGGGVAGDHDVRGDLCHGGQGADSPAVYPVTPGAVVFARGVNPYGNTDEKNTCQRQKVREAVPHAENIPLQEAPPVEVQ